MAKPRKKIHNRFYLYNKHLRMLIGASYWTNAESAVNEIRMKTIDVPSDAFRCSGQAT